MIPPVGSRPLDVLASSSSSISGVVDKRHVESTTSPRLAAVSSSPSDRDAVRAVD